jgi:hypothetical protein
MANKTIPQLPLQTGITDNDLLAIVDSGETTTSKIKVSTLLSGAGGAFKQGDASQSIVPYYSLTSRGASANTTYVDKLNLEGEVFTSNANETFNLVSSNTTITDHPYNRAFAGSNNSKISSTNTTGTNILIGTLQGQITNGSYNTLIGMGTISGGGYGNAMIGTQFTSNLSSSGFYNFIQGGAYQRITAGNHNALLGGTNNTISNTNCVILGGSSQSTLQDNEVVMPNVRITNYASLNFSGDTAAAAGGVQLGQLYHDNGAVRIRIV